MKFNIILALCLATFTLTNCSKDNKTLIVGKWTANSYTETQYKNNVVEKVETKYYTKTSTVEFTAEGTVVITNDVYNAKSGKYSILEDNKLSLTLDGSSSADIFTITNITSSELSLMETKNGSTNEYKEYLTKYTR
ncbi:MAG: hypothetical protein IPK03_09175 [Bacteroidetes bacterium]|nr:hypothetical protein [Bacteroidota bacterium]MBP7477274.1 hypothetical protein [Chitinophagales bacterium]